MRTIQYIESLICKEEEINPKKLHSRTRKREINDIRQMIMYFALIYGNKEKETGGYFDRDHATAHHTKKAIEDRYDTERLFRLKIQRYNRLLFDYSEEPIGIFIND